MLNTVIDLRVMGFHNVYEIKAFLKSNNYWNNKDSSQVNYLIITLKQRIMILANAVYSDLDADYEIYLGLIMAVAKGE